MMRKTKLSLGPLHGFEVYQPVTKYGKKTAEYLIMFYFTFRHAIQYSDDRFFHIFRWL